MSQSMTKFKIVFLVDTVFLDTKTSNKDINPSLEIPLSAFRLLSYFAELSKYISPSLEKKKRSKRPNLLWGFKFYSSKSFSLKCEQHRFKEFKHRFFEEFENEILENSRKKEQCNKSRKNHCDYLSCAIKELLADFQWDTPDIFSPVKQPKRKRKNQHLHDSIPTDDGGNFVFLFSKCPLTSEDMRHFAGKKILDEDVLVDALFGQALLNSIHIHGIKLHWIDDLSYSEDLNVTCLEILNKALQQTKGCIIPQSTICQLHKPFMSNTHLSNICVTSQLAHKEEVTQTDNQKQQKEVCSLLPYSSIIEWYTKTQRTYLNSDGLEKRGLRMLCNDGTELCTLELTDTKNQESQIYPDATAGDKSLLELMTSAGGQTDEGSLYKELSIRWYGILSDETFTFEKVKNQRAYICYECPDKEGRITDSFQKLLLQMTMEKKSLVLHGDHFKYLYVLQPFTATSGVIIETSLDQTMQIEKSLSNTHHVKDTESDCKVENGEKNWSDLVNRLVKDKHVQHNKEIQEKSKPAKPYSAQVTEKIHLPGSRKMLVSLIDKLNERASQLEFLSAEEVGFLQDLQRSYRHENHPIKAVASTPICTQEDKNVEKTSGDGRRRRSSGSVPSRGQLLVSKSRKSLQSSEDLTDNVKSKTCNQGAEESTVTSTQTVPVSSDFRDETELTKYLQKEYEKIFDIDGSIFICAQTIVTIALHFMKGKHTENPQEICNNYLREHFVIQPAVLREKYLQSSSADQKQIKIREFQMQIVLRFECLSSLQSGDQSITEDSSKVDEIVTLLRTLSFSTEPAGLAEFMKNVLVENYMHTLPQTLGNIYDELMQPLPDVLESILSPDKSGSESVFSRSLLSCEPDNNLDTSLDVISASQPVKSDVLLDRTKRNSRSRKLIHHPSLADMGSQRQIVVTNKLPTEKKKSRKSSKSKVKKDLEKVFGHEKVKLERRQSVAVMESVIRSSPRGKHKKEAHSLTSPTNFKSPPFKSPSRRKKIIAETPSHKQKARHVWKQQEKERRRSHTVTDVKVVTESPVKSDIIKDSPSQHKKALHLVRRSFYSAGPIRRTRSLAHSLQIADKISGRKRQLSGRLSSILLHNSPAVSKVELKSPDKNSSFLLSQLMGSPTTPNSRKTPKKARETTPAKLVGESPSMHTRSKSPAAVSVGKPKALFQDSPMKQFKEPEEKSHRAVGGSAKKSQSFGFPSISSPQTVTPRKTMVPDLQSPSQNTRSKVSSTPTRQSVRAALFCKSPELKHSNHKIEKGNMESPSRSNKQPFTKRKSAVVSDEAILKDQDSEFYSFQLIDPSEENRAMVSEQENTQVSWLNEKGEECRISFTEAQNPPLVKGNAPKTPSSMKGKKTRTPTSLDKWPRIKSVRNSSEKSKSNLSKSLFRNVADESSININSQNNDIFSELSQNQNSSQLSQDSVCSVTKKRGLQLSPESNLTSFSPSKRQKCSDSGYPSSSDSRTSMVYDQSKVNTRLSYCLHSRILSRKMSSIASSEGFSTVNSQNVGSQPSVGTLSQTSQPSIGSLSQTSWRSEDCFSATNDEVFVNNSQFDQTNNSQSDQIDNVQADENDKFITERSESPIFGSSRKRKYIASPENNVTENNTEVTNSAQDDVISSTSKVSPSSRKFSPNVSAKSLMHLMNSPLLKSPHDLGRKLSNPISPDNLNIRRRRISGRSSRRSLNLQK